MTCTSPQCAWDQRHEHAAPSLPPRAGRFFERDRRYRFPLTAGVYLGVLVTTGATFFSPTQGDRDPLSPINRGALNPAWIGTMTVPVTNVFLGLFGF
jgi:hypothetical protein